MDKKNKRGQEIAGILMFFVAVVIVAAFIPSIAQSEQSMEQTYLFNGTAAPAAGGSSVFLTGSALVGTPLSVINESGGTINCANNVSFSTEYNPTTGERAVRMTSNALISGVFCTRLLNVSYNYGASGYVADSGARSISQLVTLFASIALIGAAIFFFIKNGGLDSFLNR